MVEDHHRAPARRLLDSALCGATATAPRLASRRVRVRRAPEPSDILWQHTACTGSSAAARRGASAALTLLLVAVGAGLQYGLALAAERERKNKCGGWGPASLSGHSKHAVWQCQAPTLPRRRSFASPFQHLILEPGACPRPKGH
jgi:hypothetical protein